MPLHTACGTSWHMCNDVRLLLVRCSGKCPLSILTPESEPPSEPGSVVTCKGRRLDFLPVLLVPKQRRHGTIIRARGGRTRPLDPCRANPRTDLELLVTPVSKRSNGPPRSTSQPLKWSIMQSARTFSALFDLRYVTIGDAVETPEL